MTSVSTRFFGQPRETKWTFMTWKAGKATTSPLGQPFHLDRFGAGVDTTQLGGGLGGGHHSGLAEHADRVVVAVGELEQARHEQPPFEPRRAPLDRPGERIASLLG